MCRWNWHFDVFRGLYLIVWLPVCLFVCSFGVRFDGCFLLLVAAQTVANADFDAFRCCSNNSLSNLPLNCTWDYSETWGQGTKKKEDDLSWTLYVLKSLRVMLYASPIRIYSQSWGNSVDALNTTYPSPLPSVAFGSSPFGSRPSWFKTLEISKVRLFWE